MKGQYIALGCTQQARVTPTMLRQALDPSMEPWHFPHFTPHLTERLLDARQQERVVAGRPLPYLLLATGAMTGPHKRTRPINRWRLAARRFLTALGRFLAAPRIDL